MRKVLPAAVLIGMCLPAFAAGVYKWVDEDGVVHYSDKKPDHQSSQQLNVRTAPAPGAQDRPSAQEQNKALTDKQEVEKLRQQQATETAQAEARQSERCDAVKKNLETLSTTARIREKGDNGELRYLTPEEILDRKKQSQSILDNECQ